MKLISSEKGAAMVEFVIIAPILIILLFGIIEFGVLLYNRAVITNASREGARYGIVQALARPTEPQIRAIVNTYCSTYLINLGAPSSPPVTSAPAAPCPGFASDLTVTVTCHYDFLVLPGFFSSLIGGINLSAVTLMKCE